MARFDCPVKHTGLQMFWVFWGLTGCQVKPRWLEHLIRIPPHSHWRCSVHPGRGPRTCWDRDNIIRLAWDHLGVTSEEGEIIAGEKEF